jgi:hypothetical protein
MRRQPPRAALLLDSDFSASRVADNTATPGLIDCRKKLLQDALGAIVRCRHTLGFKTEIAKTPAKSIFHTFLSTKLCLFQQVRLPCRYFSSLILQRLSGSHCLGLKRQKIGVN